MSDYLTLAGAARAEYTVNKSRFIGTVQPVSSNEEALDFVSAVRREFPDARHHVFAYAIRSPEYTRFSDDGEPSGTAGKPVLDVLRSSFAPLMNAAVVVTRYFGGVLLGTGGLVRAYSHTAKIAVAAAGIVKMCLCAEMTVECPYPYYESVLKLIGEHGGIVEDTAFSDRVTIRFRTPDGRECPFQRALTELTNGSVTAEKTGQRYDAFPFSSEEN